MYVCGGWWHHDARLREEMTDEELEAIILRIDPGTKDIDAAVALFKSSSSSTAARDDDDDAAADDDDDDDDDDANIGPGRKAATQRRQQHGRCV